MGLSLSHIFAIQGGSNHGFIDFIDVDYIDCEIDQGIRYLNNDRIRKIIHDLYSHKRIGSIVYITATAACHLAKRHGTQFLAFPIAIGDFGLTNLAQTIQKLTVTVLFGMVGPMGMLAEGVLPLFAIPILLIAGLKLASINLDKLHTSAIDQVASVKQIQSRVPDMPDVVTLNFKKKVKAPGLIMEGKECWLPEQKYLNPKCRIKPTEIPDAIDMANHGLNYDEVVNMQDVTGLDRVNFSDIFDLGKPSQSMETKSAISKASDLGKKHYLRRRKPRVVNFLDKFGDGGDVAENESWDLPDIIDSVQKEKTK